MGSRFLYMIVVLVGLTIMLGALGAIVGWFLDPALFTFLNVLLLVISFAGGGAMFGWGQGRLSENRHNDMKKALTDRRNRLESRRERMRRR